MRFAILFFACGVAWCQFQPALPPTAWPQAALLIALPLCWGVVRLCRSRPLVRFVLVGALAAGIGFAWAAWWGQSRLDDALPHESEGRDVALVGRVASLPSRFGSGVRFEFAVEHSDLPVPGRVWLSWYAGTGDEAEALATPIHAGERWALTVRLKRPHGNMNPHGFDYEALLFERGLRATGYVRDHPGNRRLAAFVPSFETVIERAREGVRSRIERVLGDADFAGVIVALVVGDQRAIEQEFWTLFNRTGITHLMAISGFHITMIAALIGACVSFLWRRVPGLALRLPAQKVAVLAGWLAALGYCLIAGMGVPAQRTLCMLTIGALALWGARSVSASRVLCWSLAAVLILDPLAVLSAGFWLSFGAVAVLLFACSGRLAPARWWREAVRSQWAVTVGLMPVLLALFGQFSLVSPLANALAIPLVSFVVTPLALLGAFLPFDGVLVVAHQILAWLMVPVEWLAELPFAVWASHAPPAWAVVLAIVGGMLMMLPRGMQSSFAGVALMLPLVALLPPRVAPGQAQVTVLDVGQGLAVHVQTAEHDLLFDTGPQFSPEANSGNRIIAPYLRAEGVARLAAMVISHEDRDHSGGVHALAEALPIDTVFDSLPSQSMWRPQDVPAAPCRAGMSWQWEGVQFDFLHPAGEDQPPGNDSSCVLRVAAGGERLLIAADIEARAERSLLARGADVAADYLIAPHHGSRTSSTPAFVKAVGARVVVFPVGYRNRYRHPNREVFARYADSGANLLRTDREGALRFVLGGPSGVERSRAERRRYWHDA